MQLQEEYIRAVKNVPIKHKKGYCLINDAQGMPDKLTSDSFRWRSLILTKEFFSE